MNLPSNIARCAYQLCKSWCWNQGSKKWITKSSKSVFRSLVFHSKRKRKEGGKIISNWVGIQKEAIDFERTKDETNSKTDEVTESHLIEARTIPRTPTITKPPNEPGFPVLEPFDLVQRMPRKAETRRSNEERQNGGRRLNKDHQVASF